MRGSRFTNLVTEPTFDPQTLKRACDDMKRKQKRTSYTYHTATGSGIKRKNIDSSFRGGRNKRFKKNQAQVSRGGQNQSNTGNRGRGRGFGKDNKPRGGGNRGRGKK